jgi:uncharacterized protein DUF4189
MIAALRKLAVATMNACALTLVLAGNASANGALAIDSNQGPRYGFSHDYPTMRGAERRALNECGSNCRVVLRFSTGCGAYAADQARGSTVYGWGTARTGPGAQNRAMSECRAHGGSRCMVRAWACNSR